MKITPAKNLRVVKAPLTLKIVDENIIKNADNGHRHHLGGSLIGHNCAAYLWYVFRWAKQETFPAQVLRLFDRGHREEERFELWLSDAGISIWSHDDDGKQFRINDHHGHFGGSLDGIGINIPDIPRGEKCLLEYKTHNHKSFIAVQKKGVRASKYQHFAQMQIYMLKRNLKFALYVAINKNDDHIYTEIIEFDEGAGMSFLARAKRIIFSHDRPHRISDLPTWFECGYCTFRDICHYGDLPEKNCRTCNHATPVEDGQWHCGKHKNYIPKDFLIKGCSSHEYLPDMLKPDV